MTRLRRLRSASATLARVFVGLIAVVLVLVGVALAAIETGWVKDRIRAFIVRQANEYLTATLSIGRLEGSLLRGITLGDISVAREGRTLIHIDEVALTYSIRELVQPGVVVRRVRVVRPTITGSRQSDGHWDLGALVRRESREQERTGPSRPIEVQEIEVVDGHIELRDPLDFGAAHLPTEFAALNAKLAFTYVPVRWTLSFDHVSWIGRAPDLSVNRLSGVFGRGPGGWFFNRFAVATARSEFGIEGRIDTEQKPTELALRVRASRFAFQEWSGVLRGLSNIAVESSFDTALSGPVDRLATNLDLRGTGGGVKGALTLDTTVPGWHAAGSVTVSRLDLARWLNRADRPSDITGRVTFDLALELGRHFPRGTYAFDGAHAMYMGYEADQVHARGQITTSNVAVAEARGVAYGANVKTVDATIGIDSPFPFHFRGTVDSIDLRRVPASVPVPRVESLLTFDYDVSGQFTEPFIAGRATFAPSEFLGAHIGAETVGSIDTSQQPLRYAGDGTVDRLDPARFGRGLGVAWMEDPRYAGTISGRFRVEGTGADRGTMSLTGGGRLTQADMFRGTLSDADVSIGIEGGTLTASFDGRLSGVDASVAFADPQLSSTLTGAARVTATVRDLLSRPVDLADYDVRGSLALEGSVIRAVRFDRATLEAALTDRTLTVARAEGTGEFVEGRGAGAITFGDTISTDFQYNLTRVDLGGLRDLTAVAATGTLSTSGHVTGPGDALHLVGDASMNDLDAFRLHALTTTGHYDVTVNPADFRQSVGQIDARGTFVTILGRSLPQVSGKVTLKAEHVGFDIEMVDQERRDGRLAGDVGIRADGHSVDVLDLTVTAGRAPWHLSASSPRPVIAWDDGGVSVTPIEFRDGSNDQRIGLSGTWRQDGSGALRIEATHVFLDTLQSAFDRSTRYGGVLDLDATVRGTFDRLQFAANIRVSNGRVERVSYQSLQGRVSYEDRMFRVDVRLDQAPGVWLTAVGAVPASLFDRDLQDETLDLRITSSAFSLGLVEGVTDVIRDVSGNATINLRAIGTGRDPHFDGTVEIANAAFLVAASGSKYKNGRAVFSVARDRVTVDAFHVEDDSGHGLDLHGSLGTHELSVGNLEIDASAQRFEIMRNELGQITLDAALKLRGRAEEPRIAGDLTINSGELKVDEILQRTLFQPYATQPTAITEVDAVAALNPWQRLGLDVALHVPNTLRLTGRDVQVSPGTPIGLGDINLRVAGDLYLYKDPGDALSLTGSFDSVSGTYAFQGRRFDVAEASSINFRGDLNPEIYVTVTRVISGVETRVSITGPMRQPELHLASTPPLDDSDILSLIVFNTATNQLSSAQQQELLVRAGTLAAGFLATPVLRAIETETGLQILEIETAGEFGTGPRVTVGQEIAPGLVARFSREFGPDAFDEAMVEYYLSRILRVRATFSDAQTLTARSPFRRIERAGVDLLFFFSF